MAKINDRTKRKKWFKNLKKFMKIFIKKSEFIYLDDKIIDGSIIVSNHVGTKAPLAFELYSNIPLRFWGAFEMNSGLKQLYKYQTKVYYHQKKHWNLHLARLFCLLASPLTVIFYKGLNLISTYPDARLRKTIKESIETLKDKTNVIIFPEDSKNGYLDVLEGFHKGVSLLITTTYKNGLDVPIYPSYYINKERKYIIGKPIYCSELIAKCNSYQEMADFLCNQVNELYYLQKSQKEVA